MSYKSIFKITRTNGVPQPRYIQPLVRINGVVEEAPHGWTFDPCMLPAGLTPVNLIGNTLTVNGVQVVIPPVTPPSVLSNGVPPLALSPSVPSDVVGTDTYLLATPDAWQTIVVGGTSYLSPLYLPT